MPPTYIIFDVLIRRGSFIICSVHWPAASATFCTRIVNCFLWCTNETRCHWPSFNLGDSTVSMRLRPRAITFNWPLRRFNVNECFGLSLAPYQSDEWKKIFNIMINTCVRSFVFYLITKSTYRNQEKQPIRIECTEIELNIEVILPEVTSDAQHRVALRSVAEFECICLVCISAGLEIRVFDEEKNDTKAFCQDVNQLECYQHSKIKKWNSPDGILRQPPWNSC